VRRELDGLTIRAAAPDDAIQLAAFAARVFVETFGAANTEEHMRAYVENSFTPERLHAEITSPGSHVVVAEKGSAIVGYARLLEQGVGTADRPGIELVRLYVDSAYHGRGVADALMDACIAEAHRRRQPSMWLGVWEHNLRAQRFYARYGFVRVGEQIFMLDDDRQTDWIMERALQDQADQ
jgi:ribosomal protein S18 acetylase RimI-like enzyme